MSYSIAFQQRARKEYKKAVAWYKERSVQAAENFETEVKNEIYLLRIEPTRFGKKYKEFREIKLHKYPFNIVYIADEINMVVIISSIFHHKRNPAEKYKG